MIMVILTITLTERCFAFSANKNIVELNENYCYDEMIMDLNELREKYPLFFDVEIIGQSMDNRDIFLMKIGTGSKKILCTAGVHAREIPNTNLLMKMAEDYCSKASTGERLGGFNIEEYLKKYQIQIVPVVNPDGYALCTQGTKIIKDGNLKQKVVELLSKSKSNIYEWKANANGVDINRNFDVKYWKQVEQKPHNTFVNQYNYAYYGGEKPNSEPETLAIVELFKRQNYALYLDFHSRGRIIYWYKLAEDKVYNKRQKELAQFIHKTTRYRLVTENEDNQINGTEGTTTDYFSEKYKNPTFTIETFLGRSRYPIAKKHYQVEYERIYLIPLILMEQLQK